MPLRTIEDFIEHGELTGIVGKISRRGCSEQEILALETKYNVKLPHSYRRFLEVMGKDASLLFQWDQHEADYDYVLCGKEDYRNEFLEFYKEDHKADLSHLPDDALIIGQRGGYHFHMIRCNDPHDSPVWVFLESGSNFRQISKSFVEYLYDWCWSAEQARKNGY